MLQEIVGSLGRAEIFKQLFTAECAKVYLRELARRTNLSAPVLQRELRQMVGLGIVLAEKSGNRIDYSANRTHPLYPVLCELVRKTAGAEALLKAAFQDCNARFVFLFGSMAKGTARRGSDVDLFVIGDCGLREVSRRIHSVADSMPQEINPYVITSKDFMERKQNQDHFISEMLNSPKIFLKGTSDEFDAMAK